MSGLFGSSKRVKTQEEKKAEKVQSKQDQADIAQRQTQMKALQERSKLRGKGLFSLFSSQSGRTTNTFGGSKSLLGKSNLGEVHY